MGTEPLLNVPAERKLDIVPADQAGTYRALQLADMEQEPVISVSDEALGLRPLSPVHS